MSSNISISCAMCGRREMNGWIALVSAPGLFSGQLCAFPWLTMQFHCLQLSASIGRQQRAKCDGSLQARQISGSPWSREYIHGRTGRLMIIAARPESSETLGRESGRERGGLEVWSSVEAGESKQKK